MISGLGNGLQFMSVPCAFLPNFHLNMPQHKCQCSVVWKKIQGPGDTSLHCKSLKNTISVPDLVPAPSPLWAPGRPLRSSGGQGSHSAIGSACRFGKEFGRHFPGVETSGIFYAKQNSFHIVPSDLCYIKINLQRQLLVRALGLF